MEEGLCKNFVPSSGFVDKTKIVEVKPLRSLAPVLPKSLQSSHSLRYPSVFPPFIVFEEVQESQPSSPPPIPAPPIKSYKILVEEEETPHVVHDDSSTPMSVDDGQKRGPQPLNSCKSSQKRSKKTKESHFDSSFSAGGAISVAQRDDGDRETVNLVLMTYDSLRRRLCQLEDARELNTTMSIKRADLRASNALSAKAFRTNMKKRVGAVPGIDIGDIFFLRMEMVLVGLHGQSMGGIDYMTAKDETVALSIVSSGVYDDETEDDDVLVYSGQGENFNKKDKHVIDQKLQRGNLALDNSSRRQNEVRVIRGLRDAVNKSAKIYVYDGLYKIQDSWIEKGKSGGGVFKYKFVRLPGQPSAFAVWKSVQKWKMGSSSRTGLILSDLSNGVESIPVSLVNEVDNEKCPFFQYFNDLLHPKPFSLAQSSYGCSCTKSCVPGDLSCSCIQRNEGDFPYTSTAVLVSRKQLVHECGPMCKCFPNCKNRVSQSGLKLQMEVFKTKDRGWGLRSLDPIRAGTFICEYTGEVIDRAKVNPYREYNDEYIFNTSHIYDPFKWNYEPSLLEEISSNVSSEDYCMPSPLIISSKSSGNVARFMNHSCSPNVFWQPVLYAENNQSYLHIAFFALRHIPPMSELTYDYGCSGHVEGSNAPNGRKKCLCGSSKCRGSFG
ncbi:hypothetical protein Fmac_025270 [Flemingia macrophylla]|uniref:Histone-lysine N-methyltransferase, H3 lysine-9 specific SUVH1 n=1 Tax=Flemingia macrophylla TaxID=520843 RepID=A0ABD1LRS4_9FABA